MKKISAMFLVFAVCLCLSACQAFHQDTTQNYPQSTPYETTIYLQLKSLPYFSTVDTELTKWRGEVLTTSQSITDENATKITAVKFNDYQDNNTYQVQLTLINVPDKTLIKTVRPFKITYTQTIYNPITLLPTSDVFNYIIAYTANRRHSSSSTEKVTTNNGEYIYLWTNSDPIQFVDIYPNRPLYYLLILLGATTAGVLVYLVYRYYDCKKRKNQL